MDLASPEGGEVMYDTHSARVRLAVPMSTTSSASASYATRSSAHAEEHPAYQRRERGPLRRGLGSRRRRAAADLHGRSGPAHIADVYEKCKIVTLFCHGASLLLWTRLSNGKLLSEGKKWTGFTDEEEELVDKGFGMKLDDYAIESGAAKMTNTRFLCRSASELFAVRDDRLITGHQQYSSGITAELVLERSMSFDATRSLPS